MSDDILRAAKAEQLRLEALLQEHPIFQRLQAIRRVVELYASAADQVSAPSAVPQGPRKTGPRPGSQASAIRDGASRFLREKAARASSGEIYEALKLWGIEVKGRKPTAVVASYLSHSDIFDSTRDGYGLVEWSRRSLEQPSDSDPEPGEPREVQRRLLAPAPNGQIHEGLSA